MSLGQVLVFTYHTHLLFYHSPTIYRVEEKYRGLIPPCLKSWPLQLIEHLASRHLLYGPSGPLSTVLSPLVESEFQNIWVPNRCCKVWYATSLDLLGVKAKFLQRKPKVLYSCFGQNIRNTLTPIHVRPRYFTD